MQMEDKYIFGSYQSIVRGGKKDIMTIRVLNRPFSHIGITYPVQGEVIHNGKNNVARKQSNSEVYTTEVEAQ